MKNNCHRHIKRHYKKFAAALASAVIISAAFLPSLPANIHAAPEPTADSIPIVAQEAVPPPQNTSPEANAKQVLDVTATAYAPGAHDNGQWGNKTFIGSQVRPGVIAVDPRIIPLGSRVLIKFPDGTTQYAVAEDTGGAIKGHRIDIAKWTVNEARKFGMKPVKVYVLNDTAPIPETGKV